MTSPRTRLEAESPDAATVIAIDGNGIDHQITVDKRSGSVVAHRFGGYPEDPNRQTPAQQTLLERVRTAARYRAQETTECDIVRATALPANVIRGIDALRSLSSGQFIRRFGSYYTAVQSPAVEVTPSVVALVCYLDPSEKRFEYVTSPVYRVARNGSKRWLYENPADSMVAPTREPEVMFSLRPGSYDGEFGRPFRDHLLAHLEAQRQAYEDRRGGRLESRGEIETVSRSSDRSITRTDGTRRRRASEAGSRLD